MADAMVKTMEMESGKVLDEACNSNNDAYSDEGLYTAWLHAPQTAVVPTRAADNGNTWAMWAAFPAFIARPGVAKGKAGLH